MATKEHSDNDDVVFIESSKIDDPPVEDIHRKTTESHLSHLDALLSDSDHSDTHNNYATSKFDMIKTRKRKTNNNKNSFRDNTPSKETECLPEVPELEAINTSIISIKKILRSRVSYVIFVIRTYSGIFMSSLL